MKSAGKARSNGLYRHIRTSKEIIRNLLNDYSNNSYSGNNCSGGSGYSGGSSNGGGKVVIKTLDVYDENGNYVGSTHWYSDGTCDDPYSAGMGGF